MGKFLHDSVTITDVLAALLLKYQGLCEVYEGADRLRKFSNSQNPASEFKGSIAHRCARIRTASNHEINRKYGFLQYFRLHEYKLGRRKPVEVDLGW